MEVESILAQLRQERDHIDEAILSLERLARTRGPQRGRPPVWMAVAPARHRGRPPGSKNKTPSSEVTPKSPGSASTR